MKPASIIPKAPPGFDHSAPPAPAGDDHERGCQGREYTCTCGYDERVASALAAYQARIEEMEGAAQFDKAIFAGELRLTQNAVTRALAAEAKVAELQGRIDRGEKAMDIIERAAPRIAAIANRDGELEAKVAALTADISKAIGSVRFMDPPDGGSVTLAEQVERMRLALEASDRTAAALRTALVEARNYLDAMSDTYNFTVEDIFARIDAALGEG